MLHLEAYGFCVIKVISANKSGWPDILACSPTGKFWAIEVKDRLKKVKTGGLQDDKLKKLQDNEAVAFWCNSYDEYLTKFVENLAKY